MMSKEVVANRVVEDSNFEIEIFHSCFSLFRL